MSQILDRTGENKPERDKQGRLLPGNTANPNGRPKGSISIVETLKKELEKVADIPTNINKKTYLELLITRILNKSISDGDVAMIKDIIDRVDGRPKQQMEISGEGFNKDAEKLEQIINILTEDDDKAERNRDSEEDS